MAKIMQLYIYYSYFYKFSSQTKYKKLCQQSNGTVFNFANNLSFAQLLHSLLIKVLRWNKY